MLIVAALELWVASMLPWWGGVFAAWLGLSTGFAGLAYVFNRPTWLGKTRRWLRVLITPYLAFSRFIATAAQRAGLRERSEVAPGLWVGGFPRSGAPGLCQLDLTAELPRRGEAADYACVPMLDGRGMRPEAYDRAVRTALAWREGGRPVLVHCAYGHGRSVSVAVGVLVAEGLAQDIDAGVALIRQHRSHGGVRPYQRGVVQGWLSARDRSVDGAAG